MKKIILIAIAFALFPFGAQAVDLDADANGYLDADKGGANAALGTAAVADTGDFEPAGGAGAAGAVTGVVVSDGAGNLSGFSLDTDLSIVSGADDTIPSAKAVGDLFGAITGYFVNYAIFDAYTMLYADTDDTPAALTLAASTIPGRQASGGIVAITQASQAEMEAGTETALRVMSPANVKQAIDGQAPTADTISTTGLIKYTENIGFSSISLTTYQSAGSMSGMPKEWEASLDPDNQYATYSGIIPLTGETEADYTADQIYVQLNEDPTSELTVTCYFKTTAVGFTGGTTIGVGDTVAGILNFAVDQCTDTDTPFAGCTGAGTGSIFTDATIPAGSKIWCVIGDDPDATTLHMTIKLAGSYD